MSSAPIHAWPDRLEAATASTNGVFARVRVLAEVESTQDAARAFAAAPGDVIVAFRQTRGRGRLGRAWADTGDHGIAVTFVIAAQWPERLAIAAAVGVAEAMEPFLGRAVGIKWPNDLIVDGRKVGGILVERASDGAYVGIGVNISQKSWPVELADRAISLAQAGGRVDRLEALEAIIAGFSRALALARADLIAAFSVRDVIRGREAVLNCEGRMVCGRVLTIDPLEGLTVLTETGEERLPVALTTVISVAGLAPGLPTHRENACPDAPSGRY